MKWLEENHVELKDVREPKIIKASIVSAKCSNCGNYSEQINQFPPIMLYKFCPHCGEKVEV